VRRNTDGQIGEPLRVESDLVEQSPKAHPPKGIYIARTLVQNRQDVHLRTLNATHRDQVLPKGSPVAHCEAVTLVTHQCKVPNPETMRSGAEHQKVPGEEVAVKTSGAMKKRHRKRNITAERSGQPEKRIWGNCGARKGFFIAGSKMTRRAGVARREVNFVRKYWTRNNV
jgi:hypothetical protein